MPHGRRGDSSVTFDAATLGVGGSGRSMLGEILIECGKRCVAWPDASFHRIEAPLVRGVSPRSGCQFIPPRVGCQRQSGGRSDSAVSRHRSFSPTQPAGSASLQRWGRPVQRKKTQPSTSNIGEADRRCSRCDYAQRGARRPPGIRIATPRNQPRSAIRPERGRTLQGNGFGEHKTARSDDAIHRPVKGLARLQSKSGGRGPAKIAVSIRRLSGGGEIRHTWPSSLT